VIRCCSRSSGVPQLLASSSSLTSSPALYSTVTGSYRLSRPGRLRTDLGGVYFNAVFIAGMSLGYLATGSPWLLVAIVLLHFETAMQFLPVTRMDGCYILSDLIGVPDLFSRLGPVLISMIPGRANHPRVLELKPWVRRTITLWVVIAVPCCCSG
jgi:putative peptide zinc metalloprotease protein